MSIWATRTEIPAFAYSRGFSGRHPRDTDPAAGIYLAEIPEHCNPQEPWLRLDINSPYALSWLAKDQAGEPTPAPVYGSVVLDYESAERLRDGLSRWLEDHEEDGL